MNKLVKICAAFMIVSIIAVCATVFITEKHTKKTDITQITAESSQAVLLKTGSSGSQVKTLQQKLKNWGYYTGSVDGIYGAKTKAAVQYFQRKNNLTADGIAGPKTLAALGMSAASSGSTSGGSSSSPGSYTNNDVYMLAKLIHSEARGESYTGQVAVGAVVLNRVKSSKFPNTISGVIYQPYAFTAVNDGQFKLEPNDTAKRAAQDAMNGWDPSYGSIYYYNPAVATSSWIFSRKTVVTIGKHVFAI